MTRVKFVATAALAIVLLCACVASAAEKSNFTFSVAYGPHPVGFRVVQQYDYTRSYKRVDAEGNLLAGERSRPIQTLIWYPAQAPGAKAMLFSRYLDLMTTEDDFTPQSAPERAAKLKSLLEANYIAKNYERERVQVTRAFENALPQSGPFPVVIYAPSLSASAFENSDLCEYLASRGFIVLSSPSLGQHSRGMTLDLEGIEAQVGDIEFLMGYTRTIPQADPARIAVAGWSWGGMTNVFAALQNSRIRALVSLDGALRYQPARVKEGEAVGLVDANKLTSPCSIFPRSPTLSKS